MRQRMVALGAMVVAALMAISAFVFPLSFNTRFLLILAAGRAGCGGGGSAVE